MIALMLSQALAGGYFYSESGIVGTGRGGAVIASGSDQFAQHHNPANLIRIDHPTVNIGWSGVQQKIFFDRLDPDGGFYPTAENQAAPFNVPQLGFAMPIGEQLGFAFGFYSPFAPSSDYDPDGAQRYSIINTTIYQFSIGPSLAWQPVPWLTIGVGLQAQVLIVGERLKVTLSGEDDPQGDIGVDARVRDLFTPNANFGFLIEPAPALSVGLAVQPATRFLGRGQGTLDFRGNQFEPLIAPPEGCIAWLPEQEDCGRVFVDDDIGLGIDLPWVFRGGVAVRPSPRLEIEAAAVYQMWRALDDIVVEDIDVTLDVAVLGETAVEDRLELPASLRDTVALRLGGHYEILDPEDEPVGLIWRAGGFYETGALKEETLSVALVDTVKWQVGTGASVSLFDDRFQIDSSFAWLFFPDQEIRNSDVTQINAGVADPDFPIPGISNNELVVGNGDLSAHGWIIGFQGSWRFKGKLSRDSVMTDMPEVVEPEPVP